MSEIKIFSLRKNMEPPYDVIREEVDKNEEGDVAVVEHRFYEIELHYPEGEELGRLELKVDGEPIDPLYLVDYKEEFYIKANVLQYFSNRLGYIKVTFCGEELSVRVDASKLTGNEAEQLLSYLYDKNKDLLLSFFSGQSMKLTDEEDGDEDEPEKELSLHDLSELHNFLDIMIQQYYNFQKFPYSIIRKELVVEPYQGQGMEGLSIDWLLSHLDEVVFDPSFEGIPEAIEIDGNYGILDKVAIERNTHNFDTYENMVILGAFEKVRSTLNKINKYIVEYLQRDKHFEDKTFANYQAIQVVAYRRAYDELQKLKKKFFSISERYKLLFEGVSPRNEYPKITQVFLRKHHYAQSFDAICKMRELPLNLAKMNVLNIKFLDQVYELFNYYRIIDALKEYFKNIPYEMEYQKRDGLIYKCVSISGRTEGVDWMLNFLYTPRISRNPGDTSLVLHGKIDKKNNFYTPDFVLEYSKKHDIRYAIMDAKYKRSKVVVEQDVKDAALKYYTCLRVSGTSHHVKPDFLWLLCPDSMQFPVWRLNYDENFLPIIGVVESKPDSFAPLKQTITKILNRWEVAKANKGIN